ncbi:MAG: hypothetical protein GX574_06635 [Lentisphaerae bacterium]|nr:hypothetical protein [Lentisphaerota bacterium]HQL86878.1 metallophosphoesterase [Lentisphaeria bacterium]
MMQLERVTIQAGLSRPIKLLHISDTHLLLADERERTPLRELAELRTRYHLDAYSEPVASVEAERARVLATLRELLAYGRSHCDRIVHSGDFYDFLTAANLEAMQEAVQAGELFYSPGSHEFTQSLYKPEALDAAAQAHRRALVQAAAGNALDFAVEWVGECRLISLDNSDHRFNTAQFDALREELAQRNAPTVLLMHTPLYTPELYRELTVKRGKAVADLAGVPPQDEAGQALAAPEGCYPDKTTLQMCTWLRNEAQIRAVLAGHLHFFWTGPLGSGQVQIVAGLGYDGEGVEIILE